MRLQMVAMLPAGLCAAYLLAALPFAMLRGLLAGSALGLTLWVSVPRVQAGGRPILAPAAMRELESLATSVEEPEATLISVQHGVEWWTAWFLHTRISQGRALKPEDWQKYKYVWFMEVKNGVQPPMMQGGPMGGRNDLQRPDNARRGPKGDDENRRTGDDLFGASPFPGMPPMPSERRTQRGPGTVGPMGANPIPTDAEIMFEGSFIRLAWVKTAPESVR